MSGLAAILSSASAEEMLNASLALGSIDPIRELGLDLEHSSRASGHRRI